MKKILIAIVCLLLGSFCVLSARDLSKTQDGKIKHAAMKQYDRLVNDAWRMRWHLSPPDSNWWDINAAFDINGQYHLAFLRFLLNDDGTRPGTGDVSNWGHATSRDLFHWRFRPDIFVIGDLEKTPSYYSGHSVAGAPKPTIIVYVKRRGIFVAQATDDTLENWEFLNNGEPVIPSLKEKREYVVFDPFAWFDEKTQTYLALIGNNNGRPGHQGSPSLFSSQDLIAWTYLGPVMKAQSGWLSEREDTACVDFFPLGDKGKWVMICHVHYPYYHTRVMVGTFDGKEFFPENLTRMGGAHSYLFAPETFYDHTKKRRIYFGTTKGAGVGRSAAAIQPLELRLGKDNELEYYPLEELNALKFNEREFLNKEINGEQTLEGIGSLSMMLETLIDMKDAQAAGVKLACSPDGKEHIAFEYVPAKKIFRVDFKNSIQGKDNAVQKYDARSAEGGFDEKITSIDIPFELKPNEKLFIQIFRDGAFYEVIVNHRAFTAAPIYSTDKNSTQVRLHTSGGAAIFEKIKTADIDASMSL